MHFCIYHIIPKPHHPNYSVIGGGYVHCWINHADAEQAWAQVEHHLDLADWIIQSREHSAPVSRADYTAADEDELECFDKAQREEIALIFHIWPPEDRD
jgi:hypothetical protein